MPTIQELEKIIAQKNAELAANAAALAQANAKKTGAVKAAYDYFPAADGSVGEALKFSNAGVSWKGETVENWRKIETEHATQRAAELARVNARWDAVVTLIGSPVYREAFANLEALKAAGFARYAKKHGVATPAPVPTAPVAESVESQLAAAKAQIAALSGK